MSVNLEKHISAGVQASTSAVFMGMVYNWMCAGIALTGITAWAFASSKTFANYLLTNQWLFWTLLIAQLAICIGLTSFIRKLSAMAATGLFLLYSAVTGVTFSVIFMAYELGSIATAFFSTAAAFAGLSAYGYVTKRDLSGMGSFCVMGLFGLIAAILINLFVHNAMFDFVISCAGVLIFSGLTAYDTQKIKEFGEQAPLDDHEAVRRGVILGAFSLYLDFINLFLYLLRFMGNSRD